MPLSPFLFNMVAEALSILFHKAESLNLFNEIKVGNGEVLVSHLQYADDTIIFIKLVVDQLLNVERVLHCFQIMSGLKVNFHKSSLIGIDIDHHILEGWADAISCKTKKLASTYLGLPLGTSTKPLEMWKPVVAKFERRLAGWKSIYLSMGGRITMLKSVLASLPVYFLSLFQISTAIKNELDKIQKRFL